jgi:hypothetical protein
LIIASAVDKNLALLERRARVKGFKFKTNGDLGLGQRSSWRKAQGYVGHGGVERFEPEVLTPIMLRHESIPAASAFSSVRHSKRMDTLAVTASQMDSTH